MNPKPVHRMVKIILILVTGILLVNPGLAKLTAQAAPAITTDTACRFGVASVGTSEGYDIAGLGVGSYLDWGAVTNPSLPKGVEYIRVLRVRDDLYPETLANLPGWVEANPGGVWMVGNEPDTFYEGQDALWPEIYADRYYKLARIIRRLDPTALIGFGTIVQPTPIRIHYMQRAWNQLAADAGGTGEASRLIDIWSIHAFILNEQCGNWGTGIPPGFFCTDPDAVRITDFDDTHDIAIFEPRIAAFRGWMAEIGERAKPLWITEYGSLFPPVNQPDPPYYYEVSDELTAAFMVDTFNYMLSASDAATGMPADGDQLVQRWYWYSLNDHRYHYGGSLYNPDYPLYGDLITLVGNSFINYQADHLVPVDLYPINLTISPISYGPGRTTVNYRMEMEIGNSLFNDATCAQVSVYDGEPGNGGALIAGPLPASAVRADFGNGKAAAYWMGVEPGSEHNLCVVVGPVGVEDSVPGNNQACFSVFLEEPWLTFLNFVER